MLSKSAILLGDVVNDYIDAAAFMNSAHLGLLLYRLLCLAPSRFSILSNAACGDTLLDSHHGSQTSPSLGSGSFTPSGFPATHMRYRTVTSFYILFYVATTP